MSLSTCCMFKVADVEFDFQSTLKWIFVISTTVLMIIVLWAENENKKYEELD